MRKSTYSSFRSGGHEVHEVHGDNETTDVIIGESMEALGCVVEVKVWLSKHEVILNHVIVPIR